MIFEVVCSDGEELDKVHHVIAAYYLSSIEIESEELTIIFDTNSVLCASEIKHIVGEDNIHAKSQ